MFFNSVVRMLGHVFPGFLHIVPFTNYTSVGSSLGAIRTIWIGM